MRSQRLRRTGVMKTKQSLRSVLCIAAALTFAVTSGCGTHTGSNAAPQVSAVEEAVTIFDCQSQAVQCLGTMPSPDKIKQCRDGMQSCLSDLQKQVQAEDQKLAQCRMDAV